MPPTGGLALHQQGPETREGPGVSLFAVDRRQSIAQEAREARGDLVS
jgi:hypothetical protein